MVHVGPGALTAWDRVRIFDTAGEAIGLARLPASVMTIVAHVVRLRDHPRGELEHAVDLGLSHALVELAPF